MKKIIFLLLIVILVLTTACSRKKKIKVAVMTKLSSASIVGSSEINATKMFMEKNKVNNIEIYVYDDQWNPEESVKQFHKMREDGIDILITSHVSSCIVAIEDLINAERVFTFVTGATTDVISNKDDYIFRNIQDVISEQRSIAGFMTGKFDDLLIVRDVDNFAYTEPALKYFLESFNQDNVKIIDVSMSRLNQEELINQLQGLRFGSLYLLIGGYQVNAGNIAQLVNQFNPGLPIIYTPWMKSPTLLETAGKTLEHSFIPSHYPPFGEDKRITEYLTEYAEKFGESPTYISLNVYSALEIIWKAIENGYTKPDEIKNFILNQKTFTTRFGEIEFNRYGDIDAPFYIIYDIVKEFRK